MSTISVALSRRLTEAHAARGQHHVAAPVFGRPEAAAAAKLTIVAAGPAEAIERCRPLFEAMGQAVEVLGDDPPAANVLKIGGNFLLVAAIEAMGEAFALARKHGIDPARFIEIVNGRLLRSPVYENYARIIVEERYRAGWVQAAARPQGRAARARRGRRGRGRAADRRARPGPLPERRGMGLGRHRLGRAGAGERRGRRPRIIRRETDMTTGTVEAELLGLENRYWQAIQDKDVEAAMRLTDETCIVTGAQGAAAIDRKMFEAMMKSDSWTLHRFQIKPGALVRLVTDDVAIVAYQVHEDLTVDGKPVAFDAADASTWVRRDGRWLCVLHTESIAGDAFGRDRRV